MDYKKIFNEANLEKQEESLSRLNECSGGLVGWSGCGGGYSIGRGYSSSIPDLKFDKYTPNAIFKYLSSLKKFANVDRKYMKGWCNRNAYACQSTSDATKRFERALKEKEDKERKSAEKKAKRQTILDNFGLTEEQVKEAKLARGCDYKIAEFKRELDIAQKRYDNILKYQEEAWERAGGKELWDEILANGYELN